MFVLQGYTLVNIKVVPALVPERFVFFQRKLSILVATNSRYGQFRSEISPFIYFVTHVCFPEVHPGQYNSRFDPRSYTNFFFQGKLSVSDAKKSWNGRFRSEILRFIFFSTNVCSAGVHSGQDGSRS